MPEIVGLSNRERIYFFDCVEDYPEIGGVAEYSARLRTALQARFPGLVPVRSLGFEHHLRDGYLARERACAAELARRDPRSTFLFPNFHCPLPQSGSGPRPHVINIVHDVHFVHGPAHFTALARDELHRHFAHTRARADHVAFVSETTRREFGEAFGPPRASSLLPPIIEATTDARVPPAQRADILLAVAHYDFHPHKNFAGLVELFAQLAGQDRQLRLVVAGRGRDAFLRDLPPLPDDIRRRIEHRGYVARAGLDELYCRARAFVSLSFFEGFNMSAAEAATHRTPLVLSDIPTHRELFSGETCFVQPDVPRVAAVASFLASRRGDASPWRLLPSCSPAAVAEAARAALRGLGPVAITRPIARSSAEGGRAAAASALARVALCGGLATVSLLSAPSLRIGYAAAAPPSPTSPGAGGTGGTSTSGAGAAGAPGDSVNTFGGGGGGGGGPAQPGGAGGADTNSNAGGAAGTAGTNVNPNGGDGGTPGALGYYTGNGGGGGGGGGANGNGVAGAPTITNLGTLTGGNGGAGGDGRANGAAFGAGGGGGGGAGGAGAVLTGAGASSNGPAGTITGGNGGRGGAASPSGSAATDGNAGGGGEGGAGIRLNAAGNFTNSGTITGGVGGDGGSGFNGGDAGAGGAGALMGAAGTFTNNGTLTGGQGGAGGGQQGGTAGLGGTSGPGFYSTGGGALVNNGNVNGTNGGGGSDPLRLGSGSDGVRFDAGGTVVNNASGILTPAPEGAGIRMAGGGSITNLGTIAGTGVAPFGGRAGRASIGITGANLAVINAGTISAGTFAGSGVQPAITFTGGVNSLTLFSTSTINGTVLAFSAADALALGGSANGNFNVAQISDGTAATTGQYQNFGVFQKTGASTWTLTGTTGALTPWQVLGGTLAISSDANLGNAAGGLTLNGGALQTTASFATARTISLGESGGTILTDPGTTLTASGPVSGSGGLTKAGTGTLALLGTNTYAGNTQVNAGNLQVDGSIRSSPLTTVGNGATLSGIGSLNGLAVQSGGLVAPGNAGNRFGTLSASGPVVLATGSTLGINSSPTVASRLVTSGTAQIGSSTLQVSPGTAAYTTPVRLPILVAAGGVTGRFSTVNYTSTVLGLQPSVVYDANDVLLQFGDFSPANPDVASSIAAARRLARDRIGSFVTLRVLASVLQGFNQQINCSDCVMGFGSAGSFSAGLQGRRSLTDSLSVVGGFAYANYERGGVRVTSAPILSGLVRYDMVELGSMRPFFDVGGIIAPSQRASYSRSYDFGTMSGSGVGQGSTTSSSVFGRVGYVARLTPQDEVAAAVELSRGWQHVNGYSESVLSANPYPLATPGGTDTLNIAKAGGQWTHLFAPRIETQLNLGVAQAFDTRSGLKGSVAGSAVATPVGDYTWGEYGARIGYRLDSGWTIDGFVDGTLGPIPIGNTIHGGVGARYSF